MTRAMPRLELDFRRARRRAPWAGWTLLALALFLMADLAHTYHAARETSAGAEARLAKIGRPLDGARPGLRVRAATPEEITAARDTYQRLAMPWNQLFGALESAATERVTLVAVEPDAKTGTVRISGEGKDYPAVLDYVVQLRAAPTLAGAHLVKHELRQDGPQPSVAFSVAATWGEVKPEVKP
jgi:hypothetical protein